MANKYTKPANLKYTDLCIYIDANIPNLVNTGEFPEIETRVYEYLYHILYALSLKQNYFKNFEDYDSYAMFAATECYLSIRKKQINAGKEIRGKIVEPVKSSLNFIKKVMFPLKVEYERQNFAEVINPEAGHDTNILANDMRQSVQASYRNALEEDFKELTQKFPYILRKILRNSPYRDDPVMITRLYISCQLTFLNDIIFSKKSSAKLDKYVKTLNETKIVQQYQDNATTSLLWHLPNHMSDYIRLLVTILKQKLGDELEETRAATDLSEKMIDDILDSAYPYYEYDCGEE